MLLQRCFRSRPMPVIKLRGFAFAAEPNFLEGSADLIGRGRKKKRRTK